MATISPLTGLSTEGNGIITRQMIEGGSKAVYAMGIFQFFLGAIIAAVNVLAFVSTMVNRKCQGSYYVLMTNLWFSNGILGLVLTISNVSDRPDRVALHKAEGTVAVINSMAILASFLSLSTAKLVSIRAPHQQMAPRSALKIMVIIWCWIFTMMLIKTVVFTVHNYNGDTSVCYVCLLGFEAALLVIFCTVTILAYIAAMYLITAHLKSTVGDSTAAPPRLNHGVEYFQGVTIGILFLIFLIPFFCVIIILAIHTITLDLDDVTGEAVLTFFYFHALINPVVYMLRDKNVRWSAGRILCCRRWTAEVPNDPAATGLPPPPPPQQQQQPNNNNTNNNNHIPPTPQQQTNITPPATATGYPRQNLNRNNNNENELENGDNIDPANSWAVNPRQHSAHQHVDTINPAPPHQQPPTAPPAATDTISDSALQPQQSSNNNSNNSNGQLPAIMNTNTPLHNVD